MSLRYRIAVAGGERKVQDVAKVADHAWCKVQSVAKAPGVGAKLRLLKNGRGNGASLAAVRDAISRKNRLVPRGDDPMRW